MPDISNTNSLYPKMDLQNAGFYQKSLLLLLLAQTTYFDLNSKKKATDALHPENAF